MNQTLDECRPADLLHNMSVPAQTTISHRCKKPRGCATGIIFELEDFSEGPTPSCLLRLIRGDHNLSPAEAEEALRKLLNEHALTLPLPAAAVVTDVADKSDRRCDCLLSIATVLAKSSARVYLRDKEPNLAGILPGRRVVVLVPRGN